MITSFPIIENAEQNKKYHLHLRRDNVSINKLDFIRRKMVKNVQDLQNLPLNHQMLQLSKDCLTLINKQSKRKDWIKCNSNQKWKTNQKISNKKCPQSVSKKKKEGLNKNFNRSKTDWQHNFVGSKYLQKIKQELSHTKHSSGVKKEQKSNTQQKNMSCTAFMDKKSSSIELFDEYYPKYSFNLKHQPRVSSQKFERIKQYKERKKFRSKQPVKIGSYYDKKYDEGNFNKACNLFQKYEPLEPWEDFSCNLSSVLFSKN